MNDTASQYLDIFAVHGYSNGVNPIADATFRNIWKGKVAAFSLKYNIPAWMTETSGYFDTWNDAMRLGQTISGGIKIGRLSAWVWWQLSGGSTMSEFELMKASGGGMRYYASNNFYKYIRPGAIHILSQSNDSMVHDIAFNDKINKKFVLLLLNISTTSKTVSLSGNAIPPQLQAYRSSATESCISVGSVASTSITLPARSMFVV